MWSFWLKPYSTCDFCLCDCVLQDQENQLKDYHINVVVVVRLLGACVLSVLRSPCCFEKDYHQLMVAELL